MAKRLFTFLLIVLLVMMVGCGAQNETQPTQYESQSIGISIVDKQIEFNSHVISTYDTFDYSFTVLNDTSFDLESLSLGCVITDMDGNLLDSKSYGFHNTIKQGKTVIIKGQLSSSDYEMPFLIVPDEFYYIKTGEDYAIEAAVEPKDAKQFTITVEPDDWIGNVSQNPADSDSNTTSSFTNIFGTPTTICAHTGCNNYIANSGDTNCCKDHSNRCLDCNKYIDEDAYWCVSCIAAAVTPTCEACSKDATYSIKGITGQTEYYCTEHYNEMLELLEWLENN